MITTCLVCIAVGICIGCLVEIIYQRKLLKLYVQAQFDVIVRDEVKKAVHEMFVTHVDEPETIEDSP